MLTYFTVTAQYQAIITDTDDPGAEPDTKPISGLATFTPSTTEIYSTTENATIVLRPIVGRIDTDGVLRTLNGDTGIKLVANSPALGPLPELTYRVDYTKVVYDKASRELKPFRFTAPADSTPVDLTTVERLDP